MPRRRPSQADPNRGLRAIGVPTDQIAAQTDPNKLRLLSVKAPVSGSVIDLQIAPGAYVNDPTAAVMTIADLSTVWVTHRGMSPRKTPPW